MKRVISLILLAALFLAALSSAHAAFEPRTSHCKTPENMTGKAGNLPKVIIPSVYTKGSPLAANKTWMAYTEAWDSSEVILKRRATGEETSAGWLSDDNVVIILNDSDVICSVAGWFGSYSALEIYRDGEALFVHEFDPPDGTESKPFWNDHNGPMLLLDNNLLLILDAFGGLYACNADGSGLRKVTDATVTDFVYYDGMIYFANMDDPVVYQDVYNDTYDEVVDLRYPTLYRMKLDGSGQEKLADCGVWGLSSQGHIILYQNIDEAFIFAIPEIGGPHFLSGPLYRYDAKTGKHQPLGIEAEQYIPTPYGLAVWYNEFCIEPYDIDHADLVLHDYDGNPLYMLDAGAIELLGSSCVVDAVIEFHSYNWFPQMLWTRGLSDAYDGDEDESEYVFTTVPLDGSKKTGGVPDIPPMPGCADDDDDDYFHEPCVFDDVWIEEGDEPGTHGVDNWWFDDDDDDDGWADVYPGMFDDGWEAFDALLNQRMATRTGPGTKFTEDHGTLPQSTEIVVYAQEETSGTTWVLVEFVRNGKLARAYTGMKRIDADTGAIPKTTKKPKAAVISKDAAAYYGPGTSYLAVAEPVGKGAEVLVYGIDRGFVLIEYDLGGDVWMRAWVPESCVAIK